MNKTSFGKKMVEDKSLTWFKPKSSMSYTLQATVPTSGPINIELLITNYSIMPLFLIFGYCSICWVRGRSRVKPA